MPDVRSNSLDYLRPLYASVTTWDTALLDQALLAIAADGEPVSMNDLRTVLPELAHGAAGLYFHGLVFRRHPRVLDIVGTTPSINPRAHGKPVNVYRLTGAGRGWLEERIEQRRQQQAAARREGRAAA
ncbi:hypothetical protein JJV70_15270 [Streptomyces sp. JJ66]|uniref:hypothetical protein n=1 Tax=Streptomyces sp. JJ66 TaxID=2803843 RepID=UPI001C57E01C|nr:hypothetical protein [Streptomyces sp. JJ66]MBW1603440.1 hypothetical protein [Streptomyces sp. JJ66]